MAIRACHRSMCHRRVVVNGAPLSMGILQARILEWVAIYFSRGPSLPRDHGGRLEGGTKRLDTFPSPSSSTCGFGSHCMCSVDLGPAGRWHSS